MAVSPATITDPTLRYSILTNGSALNDSYSVVSIVIKHELNKISWAELVLNDGDITNSDFPISESNDLIPGNTISVTATYGDDSESTIFTGIIVKQSLETDNTASQLIVTCKHQAVAMTFNRTETVFFNQTDSAVMTAVLGNYSAMSSTVTSTSYTQEVMYQKMATDWDFVVSRAEFLGYVIALDDTSLTIGPPAVSGSAPLKVTLGSDILAFKAEVSAERQATSVQTNAWDITSLAAGNCTSTEPTVNHQGNLSGTTLASNLSQQTLNLNSGTLMATDELKLWADASLLRMRLAAVRGEVTFIGSALAKTNTLLTLIGVGARFNGDAFISAVTHTLRDGLWRTTAKFGLDDTPLHERAPVSYPPAFGLLPAINGLQIGIIKQLSSDPDSQFRAEVTIASPSTNPVTLWARVANPYATVSAGSVFMPEVGDEVIIGYLEDDPRYPVILGSLYSSTNANPSPATDDNNYIKMLMTKAQLTLKFDDENKIITIQTPGANKIVLSDQDKAISIMDQNGNSIKMTSSNITIDSAKDITLSASGNINLNATGKISLAAQQDVAVSGMNISNTAQMGFTGKGSATAELSASGQTTVKGAIVMIN
ncbi:type VI secretion system tip protein VgrG [Mucilaginibacter robiniae]|uniref:Type VI secretion system tip protein VgrG n=1 Tax=Mucilaginibacter robiniae TaxID=2728022 RepID=A0A7L5DYY4_9SPHI|nr:type VI secretion system tip protein VgrG [Mucilaginibacter robiniae]QJD96205.1 type VI secretion system tip protein VgrG [Mucilaginibacter robiniae]